MNHQQTAAIFDEGWRLWRLGLGPMGAPQLGRPLADDTYTLPARWDGNLVMARCIRGCQSPPGPECTCGIRFYSHTEGFAQVAERYVNRHAGELLDGRPRLWAAPTVISYGAPVGACYQDPEHGIYGSWRNYWRTGRYDVLALLGWPEYPMDALGARYGNVPVFTFDDTRSPAETLRRVASSVRQA